MDDRWDPDTKPCAAQRWGDFTKSQPLIPALSQSLTPQTGVAAPRLTLVTFSLGLNTSKLEVSTMSCFETVGNVFFSRDFFQ